MYAMLPDLDFQSGRRWTVLKKSDKTRDQKLIVLVAKTEDSRGVSYRTCDPGRMECIETYKSNDRPYIDLTKQWADDLWRPLQLRYFVQKKVRACLARHKLIKLLLLCLRASGHEIENNKEVILQIIKYLS